MNAYQTALCEHLGRYKSQRLGIQQMGVWNAKAYPHILPDGLEYLNLLESTRSEIQTYLHQHPDIKLHRGFAHLNSSQAFAFNLFYPYFSAGGQAARALSRALGCDGAVTQWAFEQVHPDQTNVDVAWTMEDGHQIFCEVKLSEAEFGSAAADERHKVKRAETYLPGLRGCVSAGLLEEGMFFKHYQLLRNLWVMLQHDSAQLVFLFPRANTSLLPQWENFLSGIAPEIRPRVHGVYAEDVIYSLQKDPDLSPDLWVHANNLEEKYGYVQTEVGT